MKIRRRVCPALVGRKEAARLLGLKPENLFRDVPETPPPLNERGIEGFEVSSGTLWVRAEIEELVAKREAGRAEDERLKALHARTSRRAKPAKRRAKTKATGPRSR